MLHLQDIKNLHSTRAGKRIVSILLEDVYKQEASTAIVIDYQDPAWLLHRIFCASAQL